MEISRLFLYFGPKAISINTAVYKFRNIHFFKSEIGCQHVGDERLIDRLIDGLSSPW